MSTPYLGTTLPSMEKWVQVHVLLSIAALTLYPLLTEGLPLQQVPPPALGTELDQCDFDGYKKYEEQCGSDTIILPSCNPGERRVWWCDPKTGLPDDFAPAETYICGNCPEGSFQKSYNKCKRCHPCTVCGEGETEEKACEMDKDTNCTVISTTESLQPFDTLLEATVNPRAPPLKPPSTAIPTNPTPTDPTPTEGITLRIITTSQTAPTIESPFDLRTTPHDPKGWLHVTFIVVSSVLALLLVLITIACCRERFKKRRLRALVHKQEFELNPMNGHVPHHNEEQPNERNALLDVHVGVELERNQMNEDDDDGNDDLIDGPDGPPDDDVEEHDADVVPAGACGASNKGTGCSGGTSDGEKDDILSPSDGLVVDIPNKTRAGTTELPSDDTNLSGNPPPESATGASGADSKDGVGMDAPTTSGGHGVSKPGETLFDGSNGSAGVPPDDQPNGTPNATTTSASGDCLTDDANSDGVDTSGSNDGDMEGPGSVRAPPSAAPEEGATSAGIDSNGTADTDGDNHGAEASGGGQDVPVVESSDDVPAPACGHSSDNADAGARDPAPEQVKQEIQADDVVTTPFLQHVAQEVSHIKIKVICRMLGLQDKDIENVETLEHKDDQSYGFLRKLQGHVGKDLTYRSLLQALKKSKNKHYADELIKECGIVMRWDDP